MLPKYSGGKSPDEKSWLQLADEWDRKAEQAQRRGDISWAEYCENKARACRKNALCSNE